MIRLRSWTVIAATLVVVASTYAARAVMNGRDGDEPVRTADQRDLSVSPPADVTVADGSIRPELDRLIRVFERRITEHTDALDYSYLGRLYLEKARLTDDLDTFSRAREALVTALELAPQSLDATELLASASYSLHDFPVALELAERAYAADPTRLGALALAGDAQLALGEYGEARRIFMELAQTLPAEPSLQVRLAQLFYLEGDVDRALWMAQSAEDGAFRQGQVGPLLSYYQTHLGHLAFDLGRLDLAEEAFARAVAVAPQSPAALAGWAETKAAQGDLDRAIELYREATRAVPYPEYVAALGDLYAITGEEQLARDQYETVELIATLAKLNEQVYNRLLAVFYADHDVDVDQALRLAEAELAVRRDVGGYDAYAWALYRNGRFGEARTASDQALALGTRDAGLLYHAGLISAALGDTDRAIEELEAALLINPFFNVIHAPEARRVLADLEGRRA